MAQKPGFKRNAKVVEQILKKGPGLQAALRAAAAKVAADIGGEAVLEEYETDRFVVGIKVPADAQARDGVATRAAGRAGLTPG
ncbi:hypothetical protein [Mycolicibacterium fluoranthenivorans]|uniref:Uncharacterized protein n=1 Tax=Mycolicibacterium fluoranthenivorans TaxID=258505 RepID=A0A7X5U435_9MYCO|nr:hypothetical protein [Mycolicibacterium fluoranthenivorans]MCV7358482.1 hypothetical protein [Mycolicibacterium fluoranthenivorans]NIH98058.1 hypothetical protein [Mycolicibacterium fluoranthenivorans]